LVQSKLAAKSLKHLQELPGLILRAALALGKATKDVLELYEAQMYGDVHLLTKVEYLFLEEARLGLVPLKPEAEQKDLRGQLVVIGALQFVIKVLQLFPG
jgi:hypothetical protein